MRGRTQVHGICGSLEYILSISVLECHQTGDGHGTNQKLAHEIHWFLLSLPQAPIKTDIYIKPPNVHKDFEIPDITMVVKNAPYFQ